MRDGPTPLGYPQVLHPMLEHRWDTPCRAVIAEAGESRKAPCPNCCRDCSQERQKAQKHLPLDVVAAPSIRCSPCMGLEHPPDVDTTPTLI